jgi:hypothetical protein
MWIALSMISLLIMVAFPDGIPPSIVRAIYPRNMRYMDPTGFDMTDCVPLADQIVKGWSQNLQERLHRDVFRSIPRTCIFEKTLGISSFKWNRIVTENRAEHQDQIICQDQVRIKGWHYNISSTCIITPSKLGSQTEAISENQPIHFSSRGKCLPRAYENLQHLANNRAVRSKSKDGW